MASVKAKITPCLWFDGRALEAAEFYCGLFPDSRVEHVQKTPVDTPGNKAGDVLVVEFTLNGQRFTGLNGPPIFQFNEAVSLQVFCATQDEIDYYWERLSAGGDPNAQQCGWLKDRYGLSWQVVPEGMDEMFRDERSPGAERAMEAMLRMKKPDIAELRRAYDEAA